VAAAFLGDDALEAELAYRLPQRIAVLVAWRGRPVVAVQGELFEELPALPIRSTRHVATVDREQVKDDQHHVDSPPAVEHPVTEAGEARQAVIAEGDEFAVDGEAVRQIGETGDEARHVPASATLDPQLAVSADQRAEAVPLRLIGIVAAGGRRPERSSIGSGNVMNQLAPEAKHTSAAAAHTTCPSLAARQALPSDAEVEIHQLSDHLAADVIQRTNACDRSHHRISRADRQRSD
jgi:hypothetical protein